MRSKILVFCPYYPPHIGGLESHADEFNKHLVNNDFEVTVFTPRLPIDADQDEIRYGKVRVIRFPAWEIIVNYPLPCFWKRSYWILWSRIKNEKYDWVISRTRFFFTCLMAGIYAKRYKVKWIHIEHGSDFVKLNSLIKSFLSKVVDYTLGRWTLKKANKVVANSLASAEFCKKLYPERRYKVIYRGVEFEAIVKNNELRERFRDMIKILFAGRLIDGKGVKDLIKAVSLISVSNWVLFIVGDGPRKWDLEKYVLQLGLSSKIIFFGQMQRTKLMGIIDICDIIVNPSYTEGLPTSVIEAAWCSKAVVATDVGGTREIIDNDKSGILVPARNPKRLSVEIEGLINNPKKRRILGIAAKKKVNGLFSWDRSIKKYIEIFK